LVDEDPSDFPFPSVEGSLWFPPRRCRFCKPIPQELINFVVTPDTYFSLVYSGRASGGGRLPVFAFFQLFPMPPQEILAFPCFSITQSQTRAVFSPFRLSWSECALRTLVPIPKPVYYYCLFTFLFRATRHHLLDRETHQTSLFFAFLRGSIRTAFFFWRHSAALP